MPLVKLKIQKFNFILLQITLWSIACINTSFIIGYVGNEQIRENKTFYTSGRFLYAPNREKVVLRGVNKMNVVTDPTGSHSFPEIAKTGANTVRIMWASWGGYGAKLDVILSTAIKFKLIPILELHDATGKWNKLQNCIDFWLRPDVLAVLKKHQRFLLLNIANEVGDNTVTNKQFLDDYTGAILQLRKAGILVPLIIDAANYGRNESYLLQNGDELIAHDPSHNLMFSWHPYDSGAPESRIKSAIDRSIDLKIPFMIGEFAPIEVKCKCCIPYQYIIQYSQEKSIGWLAWSWGVGNLDCTQMDMTSTESFESLHDWGLEIAVTSKYSIKNTSRRPAIFN